MKKSITLIFTFVLTLLLANTMEQSGNRGLQSGYLQWLTGYQGTGNTGTNIGKGICLGPDGRIFATGQVAAETSGHSNMPVVALQTNGTIDWTYEFNGGGFDMGYAIVADSDGNLYAAGEGDVAGSWRFTVLSVDSAGNFRWIYQKAAANPSSAFDIIIAPDGHVYAGGVYDMGGSSTPGKAFIASLTTSGTERWTHTFLAPAGGHGTVNSITADSQSNIYAAGVVDKKYLIYSLTSAGAQRWMQLYQGTATGAWMDNTANNIMVGFDGNIYSTGKFDNVGQARDMVTMSHTTGGVLRWQDLYVGSAGHSDFGTSVTMSGDTSVYVAGKGVETGYGDVWVVKKYTTSGDLLWTQFENPTPGLNGLNSIATDQYGYVYACGWTAGGMFNGPRFAALGLTEDGETLFTHTITPPNQSGTGDQVVIGADGVAYMVGFTKEGQFAPGHLQIAAFYHEILYPQISVVPESLTESLIAGQISHQYLMIYNTGEANLEYNIDIDYGVKSSLAGSWLQVDPDQGTVMPGEYDSITVTFDATGLASGVHYANLFITSNDPDNITTTVPVTLDVTVGVENLAKDHLRIYPVPAVDLLNVASNTRIQTIKLFDLSGNLLFENNTITDQIIRINLAPYADGAYTLQCITPDGRDFSRKFLIIR